MSSDRIEIVRELRALEKFCAFPSGMSGEDRERYLKDYLADIQEYPLDAIRNACAEWRRSGSVKFPTSGALIPIIRRFVVQERPQGAEPWRELADDEYSTLTVREKIRHHQILAHEARRKAGPMFRNTTRGGPITKTSGQHIPAEEMPDIWRRWNKIAENHEAEAKRLRGHLREPSRMAAQ